MIMKEYTLMDRAANALKEIALDRLKILQGFEVARQEFQRAAKAYQALTGEMIEGEGGVILKGRPPKPGSVSHRKIGRPYQLKPPREGTLSQLALDWLKENPTGGHAPEIAKAIGGSLPSTGTALTRLLKLGAIVHRGRRGEGYIITGAPKTKTKLAAKAKGKSKAPRTKRPAGSVANAVLIHLAKHPDSTTRETLDAAGNANAATMKRLTDKQLVKSHQNGNERLNFWNLTAAGKAAVAELLQ